MAVDWSQFKPLAPQAPAQPAAKPEASAVDWSQFKPVQTSADAERTWGEAVTDTATGIGQSGLGMIGSVARALNTRQPGTVEAQRMAEAQSAPLPGLMRPAAGIVAGYLNDAASIGSELGSAIKKGIGNVLPDSMGGYILRQQGEQELQAKNAQRAGMSYDERTRSDFMTGFADQAGDYAGRVPEVQSEKARLISQELSGLSTTEGLGAQAAGTIDYFASPFLRGDLATGGARVSKIMESLIPSLAAGGGAAKLVGAVGGGALAQTAGQLGTMSVAEAAGAGDGARSEVLGTPIEQLQAAPEYQAALRMTGGDPIRAREILADQAASIATGAGFAVAAGTMGVGEALGANVAERAIREGATSLATGGGVRAALMGVAGGTAKEFGSEFVQGAGNQLAQNLGTVSTGASDSLGRGVVAAGLMEGLAGAGSGAAAQTAGEVMKRLRPIEAGEDLLGGPNVSTGAPGAAQPGGLNLPDDPDAEPITSAEIQALRDQQLMALQAKRDGIPEQQVVDPVTGAPVVVRGQPAQSLSEAETKMLNFLDQYAERPDVLARALSRRLDDSATSGAPADTSGAAAQTSEAPAVPQPAPLVQQAAPQPAQPLAPEPVQPAQQAAPRGPVATALQPADDLLLDQAAAELQGMDEESPPIAGAVAIDPQPEAIRNEEAQQVTDADPAPGQVPQQGLRPQGQQEEVAPAPASAPQTGIVAAALAGQLAPVDPEVVEGQLPAESTFAAQRAEEAPAVRETESFLPQLMSEIGWSERGGRMLRDPSTAISKAEQDGSNPSAGDVVGRTQWIGKPAADGTESLFWRMRPNQSLSESQAGAAVKKWREGRKLAPREHEFVNYMQRAARDYAEQWAGDRAQMLAEIADLEAAGIAEERDELRAQAIPDATPEQEREALALQDMLVRARSLGVTREELAALIQQNPKRRDHAREIWHLIKQRSPANGTDEQASNGGPGADPEAGSRGQTEPAAASPRPAREDAEPDAAGSAAAGAPAEELTLAAPAAPAVSQQAAPRAQQGGLFAPPTRGEVIDGERRRRDAERNGETATGRTDIMAGDGELFAGPRPEQVDVEQAIEAEQAVSLSQGEKVEAKAEYVIAERMAKVRGARDGSAPEFEYIPDERLGRFGSMKEAKASLMRALDPSLRDASDDFAAMHFDRQQRNGGAFRVVKAKALEQDSQSAVEAAAAEAAASPLNDRPEPTDAQREAGNYKKGALSLHGLRISIENPAGTRRRPEWPPLAHHYGYFRGTEGKDGDHVDVFIGPDAENADLPVFVVDQVNKAGRFDEHKVMLGFADEAAAREGYLANYSAGWTGLGDITQMTLADFKTWVMDPARTSKRASADAQLQEADEFGQGVPTASETRDSTPTAGTFSRPRPSAATDQTQTPEFKAWFGDWEALRAQQRLDALAPVEIAVPARWRGLSAAELRRRVAESLQDLIASGEPLQHPEIGEVRVTQRGVKKAISSSADPAKLLVLGDLRRAFEASIYASSSPAADKPGVTFEKLLGKVRIGAVEAVAVFSVQRMADGQSFYNAATLEDGQKKAPVASPRDTPIAGERASSANTGAEAFVRRALDRVNPDSVSKVADAEGKPLVVYHGTDQDFGEFERGKVRPIGGERFADSQGFYFAEDPQVASNYGGSVLPVFLSIKNPLRVEAGDFQHAYISAEDRKRLEAQGFDGVWKSADGATPAEIVAFRPEQIKSAIGNRGTFDPADPRITFSQPQPGDRIPMGPLRSDTAMRFAVAAALDGWNGQKPIVRVVRTSADLPADAKMGEGWQTAEGYFDGADGVWLVTENLSDPQRALEVLRHEAVGHFGVERIAGAAWPSIVAGVESFRGQRRNSMSKPMAAALAEAEARYEAAASDDPLLFAKELLAVMAETGTRASFMDRMLSQLRAFLRKTGLIGEAFSEAELRGVLSGAFRLVERGGSLTAGAPAAAGGMQSIRPDDVAAYILRMMGQSDADLFRYPKSDSTSFAQVVKKVSRGEIAAVKLGEVEVNFTENTLDMLPAMKWGLRLPNGSQAFVYVEQPSAYTPDSGLRMFIDASDAEAGASLGSAAYAALFQWALNTGHTFIGDPNGLSTEALLRRTEHMLSAALKHGTTRMMAPHDRQVDPMNKRWGPSQDWAHPLQWTDGDDVGNITALIRTSVENHRALLKGTEADGAVYRLSDGQFVGSGGQPLTDEGLRRAAATAGERFRSSGRFAGPESRAAAVGGSTVARTLVLGSMLDGSTGTAGERRALLADLAERLSAQRLTYDRARELFYSRPGQGQIQLPQNPGQSAAATSSRAAILAARQRVQQLTSQDAIDKVIYEIQDRFVDLKRIQAHIREAGGTVSDLNDAYLGEELYHSRVMARHERFMSSELKPLLADLNAAGFTVEQFEQFLHARHAPEANAALMEANPDQATVDAERTRTRKAVEDLQLQLQRAQVNGYATRAIEDSLKLAGEEADHWKRVQPFRGTASERAMLSGMSDADAAAIMAALPPADRAKMDALAARVDAINAKTLDQLERYGLESRETLDQWRGAYRHYVPLHRDEAHPDSPSHPTGSGFSVTGRAARARVGSAKAKVTNILAHIAMQREAAITRGEKNSVAKRLYVLAGQNPDPDLWALDKAPTIKERDPKTGTTRTRPDPNYKIEPNVIVIKIAGQDRTLIFNERNERAVRLAMTLKNLDVEDLDWFSRAARIATRWFASVNTQYNPVWGGLNLLRDTQAVALQLSTTPLKGREQKVVSRIPAMFRAIYRERRGKGAANAEDARNQRLWDDMRMTGGVTGYRDLFRDPMERAKAIKAEVEKENRGLGSRSWHATFDLLSDFNEALENATRLAAYEQALAIGMPKQRAASIAKNITVNFNRKGRLATRFGAWYAFFNAAIQGNVRMAETLLGPRGRQIMVGGVTLGLVSTLIGMAVMGAEWEKIPDHEKEKNLIIPLGSKDYIKIPMALGFHVLPNIGRIAVEMMMGTDRTAAGSFTELLRIMADAFNPLGSISSPWQMIAPTVIDPVLSLIENKDWTGRPIAREDFNSLDPTPGFARAKDSASAPGRLIAWGMNSATGGDDYEPGWWSPTPDQIDYLFGQIGGGAMRELLKAQATLTAPFSDEELPAYKIPLVSRLYGSTSGQSGESGRFYTNITDLNIIERRIKGMAQAGEDVDSYIAAEPLAELVGMGTRSQSVVQRLRSAQRQASEAGDSDQAKAIGDQITEIMAELNREVREAKR